MLEYIPNDLEHNEWLTLVDRMVRQYRESEDQGGLRIWLCRHFPFMMKLVPRARFASFLDGFLESYSDGEMLQDFPKDFEPVGVDLDDPCGGVGYIRVHYVRPKNREVVYQCPAASCREVSRVAVEKYAKTCGLPVVDLGGGTIATVRDVSELTPHNV